MSLGITDDDIWEISAEIRRQVFCEEGLIPDSEEFDDLDSTSRHLIGYCE
jgi:hypothetical protein